MGLDQIIGNERVKEYIRQAVAHKKVSHAYIIEGEKGSGKKLITDAFISLLGVDAPDVIRVTHEKPNIISVDEIRHFNQNISYGLIMRCVFNIFLILVVRCCISVFGVNGVIYPY